ncbi:cupredoxin domain-containing protein [Vitiosangium sp. GDMCC 1.1324]|uniref:cupredoxin domain-containing protein n=1 Tax=Vitiosangium sp. (strain GDMCC 1.1324) TaxID=2138576 RepID=UPI000D3DB174|nr:cupredoxin domain-containing protein [Vitiosangium sp. GDMCC 1.1324]PTL81535.1 copper-binding protein [Vitiosangium sp. GDMCC 1.1324]
MSARSSRSWRGLPLAVCLLGGVLTHSTYARESPSARVHHVRMKDQKFVPEELVVRQGDTVIWVNEDAVTHTVMAVGGGAPAFDSGNIQPKASWRYVAKEKGRFPYLCSLHPGMHGVLTVR